MLGVPDLGYIPFYRRNTWISLISTIQKTKTASSAFNLIDLQRYTPEEVRLAIQALMAEDRTDLAVALGEAGISLHPHSPDLLSITALLAVTQQDWTVAIERLTELVVRQGVQVQPFTHLMLVRSLRCDLSPTLAMDAVNVGLAQYPDNLELLEQYRELKAFEVNAFDAIRAD